MDVLWPSKCGMSGEESLLERVAVEDARRGIEPCKVIVNETRGRGRNVYSMLYCSLVYGGAPDG